MQAIAEMISVRQSLDYIQARPEAITKNGVKPKTMGFYPHSVVSTSLGCR
jgi:hypothetical protein